MSKQLSKDWISTAELAKILGCCIDTIYRFRSDGLLKKNEHWRVLNPTAARVTYRWNRSRCQNTLQSYEVKD